MLTSEQLRVIYRLYKSVTCTAEFIFFNKHGTGYIKKKRCGFIFFRNMEQVPQTTFYSFREEKL